MRVKYLPPLPLPATSRTKKAITRTARSRVGVSWNDIREMLFDSSYHSAVMEKGTTINKKVSWEEVSKLIAICTDGSAKGDPREARDSRADEARGGGGGI